MIHPGGFADGYGVWKHAAATPNDLIRSAWSLMPFDVAILAEQHVTELDGAQLRLGDLWLERPQVLLFLRHFG